MKKILLLVIPLFAYAASPSIAAIEQAMNQGKVEQVEQMSKTAVAEHPNSAKAHYFLGQAYLNENKLNLAYVELSKAQELDPSLRFTKKPDMFKDMLARSKPVISSTPIKEMPSQISKESKTDNSGWLQTLLIAIGITLGTIGGLFYLKKTKRKNDQANDLGPDFYLDDELDKQVDTKIQNNDEAVTLKDKTNESLNTTKNNRAFNKNVPYASGGVVVTRERIITKESNNDSGLLTGLILGNMLSGSSRHETIVNNNETIINNPSQNDTSDSSGDFAGDSSSNSIFDSSSSESSWGDSSSGSSSFDGSSDDSNW